jgi:SAM-dependent methyltransferase
LISTALVLLSSVAPTTVSSFLLQGEKHSPFLDHPPRSEYPTRPFLRPLPNSITDGPRGRSTTSLYMGLDAVTYLRTEWVSAALVSNQIPRAADVCLQLGSSDGRIVNFVPRTMREIITSSTERDGKLTIQARRQLNQQLARRNAGAKITFCDQRADDLCETPSSSVDVVVSLQAAAIMRENGQDWKRSIREAARVLKPGGRFLFVEQTTIDKEYYLEYVQTLLSTGDGKNELVDQQSDNNQDIISEDATIPVFSEVGFDDVDLVLEPHIAGVAIKAMDAGLTASQRMDKAAEEEQDRLASLSIEAFERGIKKRKRRKKKKATESSEGE